MKRSVLFPLNLSFLVLVFSFNSFASDDVASVTQVSGDVRIFSHPGQTVQGPAPHAKFEGEFFSVRFAEVGDKVEAGNIIRVGITGKARLVYANGDQINVGSGSAYRVQKLSGPPTLKLMYGKIRGVISKKGPRRRLRVRTHSATMGVRGTDFFISDQGPRGGTEVSVLRGQVQVEPEVRTEKKVVVNKGFSAAVAPKEEQKKVVQRNAEKKEAEKKAGKVLPQLEKKVVELRQTNKVDLAVVHRASTIAQEEERQEKVDEKTQKKIADLEKKAVEMTLTDIRETDQKLFAKISQKPVQAVSEINSAVVREVFEKAPSPDPSRPFKGDLEDLEDDAYRRYFKIDE